MAKIDFLGKGDIAGHHLSVPFHTLEADKKKSIGGASLEDNLIIHGDNLLALKALLPRYAGQVKCIYIDPPYNTGNADWVYNDKVNSPLMKSWLRIAVDREDQTRHDKWLCMMWPRLQILKDLLRDDGAIFVSIDDNEQHYLRSIMDEIFGEENFISAFNWQTKKGAQGMQTQNMIVPNHEYILVYSKMGESFTFIGEKRTEEGFSNPYNDKRGPWKRQYLQRIGQNLPIRTIVNPENGMEFTFETPYTQEKLDKWILEKRIVFPQTTDNYPARKEFLNEYQRPKQLVTSLGLHATKATTEKLYSLFGGEKVFSNPKPDTLLKYLFSVTLEKNDIILDSFAGSGTTAHAVLDLNKEDGGNRKFILVECEDYADSITAERVRRVIKGVPKAKDESLREGLGGNFTYVELGAELDPEKLLSGETLPEWSTLARHVFWLATGEILHKDPQESEQGFVGKHNGDSVYLRYKPDIAFLQSNDSVLTGAIAEELGRGRKSGERIVYYATASYVNQRKMDSLGIVFCQLPWAIVKQTVDG